MRRKRKESNDKFLWVSYSDLATSLLLSFMLVCLLSLLNFQKSSEINNGLRNFIGGVLDQRKDINDELTSLASEMVTKHSLDCPGVKWEATNESIRASADVGHVDVSIWFNRNKDEMNPQGQTCLRVFAPKWVHIFYKDPRRRELVSQLLIEGHTDSTGQFMENLILSQKRAFSASQFVLRNISNEDAAGVLGDDLNWLDLKQWMQKVLAANGRSYNELIFSRADSQEEDKTRSRRVEFKYVLKTDYKKLKQMSEESVK